MFNKFFFSRHKVAWILVFIIGLILFTHPNKVYATRCCIEMERNEDPQTLSAGWRITACRVVVQHEQCGREGNPRYSGPGEWPTDNCEQHAQGPSKFIPPGEFSTFERDVTSGHALCAAALPIAPVAPERVPTEEVLLPRLQIPLPTLQPFTAPYKTVTETGKTVLIIKFLTEYIVAIYRYLVGIASILAGVMIIWAGVKWLTSAGSPERIGEAKKKIAGALVGLVLVLGSYVILNIINPELTLLKPLQVEYVPRILLALEPKTDESADASELSPQNCSTPGFQIASIDGVDTQYESEIRTLVRNKGVYQEAAAVAGVPWEMIATVHYKEAGATMGQSALNGGKICNANDDPTLLSWCSECSTPTVRNDFICAGKLLKKKVGALNPTTTDINAIKLAFCKFNGCPSSWRSCPEASPYVGPFFDAAHQNYTKSGLDCVTQNCNTSCTTNATVSPRTPRGCCTIKVFKKGQPPPGGFSGSLCNENQINKPQCIQGSDAATTTYKYTPSERTGGNPCGTWVRQTRIGALTIYALLKKAP